MTICYTPPWVVFVSFGMGIVGGLLIYLFWLRKKFWKTPTQKIITIIFTLLVIIIIFFVMGFPLDFFFNICRGLTGRGI